MSDAHRDHPKVLLFAGTRPEVIKLFPVWRSLRARNVDVRTIAVRQQAALLDQTFSSLDWQPDKVLERGAAGVSLHEMFAGILLALGREIDEARPDAVVVQGDTTTALAGGMAGFYAKVPVAHVEAGLRTWNLAMPFPEEMHRALLDQFATLCFAPTALAAENLGRAGVPQDRVSVTGNTVIDALRYVADALAPRTAFPVKAKSRRVVVTCHRRENFEGGVVEICRAIRALLERHTDVDFIVTKHPNPNVARHIERELPPSDRLQVVDPVPYRDFVHMLKGAWLILTDSGGIQEEATALGKPLLILREGTERPEAIGAGRVVGAGRDDILAAFEALGSSAELYAEMAKPRDVFGDGRAGERIAERLVAYVASSASATRLTASDTRGTQS